tara:strand:+ start:153630 stop:154586 length:957 start_codon:yes stop_codon:yes gene_type:complete
MVGAVLVWNNTIIGEGYHQIYGGPHAEVNAINSVVDKSLLSKSTIYVSLEPCSHFGKTPPCADLIIANKIPKVVMASIDSNAVVCGNGISKLKASGIEVITGVLEKESQELNRSFNTFHQKKRPHIILKWAQTKDGFIDTIRKAASTPALKISNNASSRWVHKIRSEVDAILIGKKTAQLDNPSLSTRKWAGKSPIRIIIDHNLSLSKKLKVFDNSIRTIVFNSRHSEKNSNTEYIKIDDSPTFYTEIQNQLWKRNIQSILVEGGAYTLQQFIDQNLWDQVFIIQNNSILEKGVKAPVLSEIENAIIPLNTNSIYCYE